LTFKGRCEKHKRTEARQYDQQRRAVHDSIYDYRWRQYSKGWLRQHPLCGDRLNGVSTQHSYCAQQGYVVAASVTDHIEPHKGDLAKFLDPENHQSLCAPCHNRKTATEDGGFGNRRMGPGG